MYDLQTTYLEISVWDVIKCSISKCWWRVNYGTRQSKSITEAVKESTKKA